MILGAAIFEALGSATLASTGSAFGMPEQASTLAPQVDRIYDIINWICGFFFVVIVGVMLYFMFKYRRREHVADTGGPTHNTPLEVTWTIIPLILVIAIFYIGLEGYVKIRTPPQNAYVIEVIGTRWSWAFNYPNGAKLATPNDPLLVPVNRPVKLLMRSNDVIHSMFLPAFRVKQDVVPGRFTHLWFEATKEGKFPLFCAEYCGTQHSQMIGTVEVVGEDEFEERIDIEAKWMDKVPDENLHLAGTLIYNQCGLCHTLDGSALIGPSFKETHELFKSGGSRRLADGRAEPVTEAYLRKSILEPLAQIARNHQTDKAYPSSMTPGIGDQLGPRRVDAMIRMIMRLDEVTDDEWNLIPVNRADIVVEDSEDE